jgi:hypothetical protein
MKCSTCEAPKRQIWPPSSKAPSFNERGTENWMSLCTCPSCGALWAGVPYEPCASVLYFVPWTKTENEWLAEIRKSDGESLHKWHKQQLLNQRHTLTEKIDKQFHIIANEALVVTLTVRTSQSLEAKHPGFVSAARCGALRVSEPSPPTLGHGPRACRPWRYKVPTQIPARPSMSGRSRLRRSPTRIGQPRLGAAEGILRKIGALLCLFSASSHPVRRRRASQPKADQLKECPHGFGTSPGDRMARTGWPLGRARLGREAQGTQQPLRLMGKSPDGLLFGPCLLAAKRQGPAVRGRNPALRIAAMVLRA